MSQRDPLLMQRPAHTVSSLDTIRQSHISPATSRGSSPIRTTPPLLPVSALGNEPNVSYGDPCFPTSPRPSSRPHSGRSTPSNRPCPARINIPTAPLLSASPESSHTPTSRGRPRISDLTGSPEMLRYKEDYQDEWDSPTTKSQTNQYGTRYRPRESHGSYSGTPSSPLLSKPKLGRKRSATTGGDSPAGPGQPKDGPKVRPSASKLNLSSALGLTKFPSFAGVRRKKSRAFDSVPFPVNPTSESEPRSILARDSPQRRRSFDSASNLVCFPSPSTESPISPPRRVKSVSYAPSPPGHRSPFYSDDQHSNTEHSADTHASSSAYSGAISPFSVDQALSLSSAATSLSRSAQSSREGGGTDEESDPAKLQRYLIWKQKQKDNWYQLDKRRHNLLELVQTSIGHANDLRILALVYLPQLLCLPNIGTQKLEVAGIAAELEVINTTLSRAMAKVLWRENIGLLPLYVDNQDGFQDDAEAIEFAAEVDASERLERAIRDIAKLMLDCEDIFGRYKDYCVEVIDAHTILSRRSGEEIRNLERRCATAREWINAYDLEGLLAAGDSEPKSHTGSSSRMNFRDYLHKPVQRIGQLSLLIGRLLENTPARRTASDATSETSWVPLSVENAENLQTLDPLRRLYEMIKQMGENADRAQGVREMVVATATARSRFEPHAAITPRVLDKLGLCHLIADLGVLYQHPKVAPLTSVAKAKQHGAFLFKGYLILARVKSRKNYEVKHYLPLKLVEIVDVYEGPLEHTIRFTLGQHTFDLFSSCAEEKAIWQKALQDAREDDLDFSLGFPCSTVIRTRNARQSSMGFSTSSHRYSTPPAAKDVAQDPSSWRHTIFSEFPVTVPLESSLTQLPPTATPESLKDLALPIDASPSTPAKTHHTTPSLPSLPFSSPEHRGSQIYRRPVNNQREETEKWMADIISTSCSLARQSAKIQKGRQGSMGSLGRKKSLLDMSSSESVAYSGQVRGLLLERRPIQRASLPSDFVPDPEFMIDPDTGLTFELHQRVSADGDPHIDELGIIRDQESRESVRRSQSSMSFFAFGAKSKSLDVEEETSEDHDNGVVNFRTKKIRIKDRDDELKLRQALREQEKENGMSRRPHEARRKPTLGYGFSSFNMSLRGKSVPATPLLSPAYEHSVGSEDPMDCVEVIEEPREACLMEGPIKVAPGEIPSLGKSKRTQSDSAAVHTQASVSATDYEIPPPFDQVAPSVSANRPITSATTATPATAEPGALRMSLRRSMSWWGGPTRSKSVASMNEVRTKGEETDEARPARPNLPGRRKSVKNMLGFNSFTKMPQ